ncbi:TPA: PTS sugar transporter subunit IIA [Enterococcus faecium]
MVSIIISGHGNFSLGLLDAFEMIFGKDDQVKAVPFCREEGIPQLQEKFQQAMEELPGDEAVLFLVDIFGGTPYNAAAQLLIQKENVDIVTGVNLPMLLEASGMKESTTLAEMVERLKSVSYDSVKVFSDKIKQMQTRDDEEDLL